MEIFILNIIIESENWHFNSEFFYLTSKNLKIDIEFWIIVLES